MLRFIERRIDSVPHLEALLLLWENAANEWTAEQIAARIYVSREHAGKVLRDLANHGLIVAGAIPAPAYRYNIGWDEADVMSQVAANYRRHLARIAGMIHAKSASEAVREFARAFEIKHRD
ncbi:MAG: hypothetical protein QM808_16165 [Steroidobacteraceae bacterium]